MDRTEAVFQALREIPAIKEYTEYLSNTGVLRAHGTLSYVLEKIAYDFYDSKIVMRWECFTFCCGLDVLDTEIDSDDFDEGRFELTRLRYDGRLEWKELNEILGRRNRPPTG